MLRLCLFIWALVSLSAFNVSASAQSPPTGAYIVIELDRETLRWSRLQEISSKVSAALAARDIAFRKTSGVHDRSLLVHLQRAQDRKAAQPIIEIALSELGETQAQLSASRDLIRIAPSEAAARTREEILIKQVAESIRERLNAAPFGAVSVFAQSNGSIAVTASDISDPLQFRRAFGHDFLTFHLVNADVSPEDIEQQRWPITDRLAQPAPGLGFRHAEVIQAAPLLTSEHIAGVSPYEDERTSLPVVGIRFDGEGTRIFCELTRAHIGRRIAVLDHGDVITAPTINEPICGGEAQIFGGFDLRSAVDFAHRLAAGNLPAPIVVSGQGQGLKPDVSGLPTRQIAILRALEEDWGFVRSIPADSGWAAGLRGGQAACGGPKALRVFLRREFQDDGRLEWRLRLHPDQPSGALVTSVNSESGQVTTEFLGETRIF